VAQGAVALAFSQAATQFPCTILIATRQHDRRSERQASDRDGFDSGIGFAIARGLAACGAARVNVAEQRLLGAQLCNGYGFKANNRSAFVRDNDGMESGCSCR
jgi:hypothetical protein